MAQTYAEGTVTGEGKEKLYELREGLERLSELYERTRRIGEHLAAVARSEEVFRRRPETLLLERERRLKAEADGEIERVCGRNTGRLGAWLNERKRARLSAARKAADRETLAQYALSAEYRIEADRCAKRTAELEVRRASLNAQLGQLLGEAESVYAELSSRFSPLIDESEWYALDARLDKPGAEVLPQEGRKDSEILVRELEEFKKKWRASTGVAPDAD